MKRVTGVGGIFFKLDIHFESLVNIALHRKTTKIITSEIQP
jgi:hypothetical protein